MARRNRYPADPFRVIVADPPWQTRDKQPGERGAAYKYKTLSLAEIMGFELPPIADDAILFLWRISCMVPEAYQVARAWGFDHRTEMVWNKLTPGGKRHFGQGWIVRASHESCIVAVRGRYRSILVNRNTRSTFEAPTPHNDRGQAVHSAKPHEFFNIVRDLTTGPRASIFERVPRDGFHCYGDQLRTA